MTRNHMYICQSEFDEMYNSHVQNIICIWSSFLTGIYEIKPHNTSVLFGRNFQIHS